MPHRIHPKLPEGFAYADRLQVASYDATGSVSGAAKVILVAVDPRALEDAGPDEYPSDYYDYLAKFMPPRLACRLRPPRRWGDIVSDAKRFWTLTGGRLTPEGRSAGKLWYIDEYQRGWGDTRRGVSRDLDTTNPAYDDGFRDAAENRMKWHLTYCPDHGDHESGCGA